MKNILISFMLFIFFVNAYAVTDQQIMFAYAMNPQGGNNNNATSQSTLASYEVKESKIQNLIEIKKQIAYLQQQLPELERQCRNSQNNNFLMTGFPPGADNAVINLNRGGGSCEQISQVEAAITQLVDEYNEQLNNV